MPVPDELDSFAEFSSDRFRNLDEVVEFHDNTAEFPMDVETDSAVLAGPLEGTAETEEVEVKEGTEGTEEVKREKELSDKNAKEFIKNATNISSAQALAPVAVALVVTSAIVVPFIENMDVEVNLNMEFVAGILSYSIEIINGSEDEVYEAFVYEGSSIIKETVIENGQLTDSIGGLPPYKEHRVEVRSGSPALYVLETSTIPAAPSWAEWGHLTVGFDVIDYGVYYYGNSGEATITLEDPYDEDILYSKALEEGFNSDIITGLRSSHLYTLTVASDSTLYLYEELETEYSDVEWDHLTIIDNTIDYGVISDYSIENLTISLYDPDTSSVVYAKELLQGYDSDTIVDLQFGHAYELTVATEEEIYLFETVVTDSEPVTVTVGHITPVNNTIDYEITVSGEGKTLTLNLYDIAGGPPVFTATLKSGVNNKIIEGLQYSHSYLLTVTSSTKTYVSESVTTETEPTKVTLGHLKATQTTVDYEVTVTGNRDVATAYLKDPTSGRVLYSKELKVGVNSAIIERLEVNHTYQFTVSSKTETFINQNITTDPKQTEVVLNHLKVVDNTIDYEVTVSGSSDTVAAHLYDSEGTELYSVPLSIGSNTGVLKDLEYGSTYNFVVSSETKRYVESPVTIEYNPTEVVLNDLSSSDNTISYDVTVTGTSDVITAYLYDDSGTEIYAAELSEGPNEDVIEDLEYDREYHFSLASEARIYINETISTEAGTTVVTVEKMEPYGDTIEYNVHVEGRAKTLVLIVSDIEIEEIEYARVPLAKGDNIGAIDEGLDYGTGYLVTITDDTEEYYTKSIFTDWQYWVYAEPAGKALDYEVTIFDVDLIRATIALFDAETQVSEPIPIAEHSPTGVTTIGRFDVDSMEFLHEYRISILLDGREVQDCEVWTEDRVNLRVGSLSDVPALEYTVTVYDTDYSDMSIAIYDTGEESEPTELLDSRPITGPTIKDTFELPSMNFNKTYYVAVENSEGVITGQSACTDNLGSILMTASGNTITCSITIFPDVDDVTIRLYYDEECKVPSSEIIAVIGKGLTQTFEDLEYNHTYYCALMWKGSIAYTEDRKTDPEPEIPTTVELVSLSSGGDYISYEYSMSGNTDVPTLTIYEGNTVIDTRDFAEGTSGIFTGLDPFTDYTLKVVGNKQYCSDTKSTEVYATISIEAVSGNVIYSKIKTNLADYRNVTVGLYYDTDLEEEAYSSEDISGDDKMYTCSGLEYDTLYYISVKCNGVPMVSTEVTTEKKVTASMFELTDYGLSYDVSVNGDFAGTLYIMDMTDPTRVSTVLQTEFNSSGEIEGDFTECRIGHTYLLQANIENENFELGTEAIDNPVVSFQVWGSDAIRYEIQMRSFELATSLYVYDVTEGSILWDESVDETTEGGMLGQITAGHSYLVIIDVSDLEHPEEGAIEVKDWPA